MSEDTGTYICYVPKTFTKAHQVVIAQVDAILQEHAGYSLTVRQVFYQGVTKGFWPNQQREYSRLGGIISEARLAGQLPWNAFEDRGRGLRGYNTVSGPREAMSKSIEQYKLDLWSRQDYRPEVWIEKQALEGVISEICGQLRVDFFSCKGYNSQSEQWRAGQRFAQYVRGGQRPIVFHLGDHDPSGIDMTRDNQERLSMFAGVPVMVVRIALNMNQVDQYQLVENPLKMKNGGFSDSRAAGYIDQYGHHSWELDALSPKVIRDLIESNVMQVRNQELWDEALEEETMDIRHMTELMMEQYPEDDA